MKSSEKFGQQIGCGLTGLGPFALLTAVLFLVFKLAEIGAIQEWGWIWILSPIWMYLLLWPTIILLILCTGLLLTGLAYILGGVSYILKRC